MLIRGGNTQIVGENNFERESGTPQSYNQGLRDDDNKFHVLIAEDNATI